MPIAVTFKRGDVVDAPFPMAEDNANFKTRPCLILHDHPYPQELSNRSQQLVLAAYISKNNARGAGVLIVEPDSSNGLATKSCVYFRRLHTFQAVALGSHRGRIEPSVFEPVLVKALQITV